MIRHGHTAVIGQRITGRLPGVCLTETGEAQARGLAGLEADAIVSSPLERAIQTATPLADRLGLPIQVSEAFSEVDFGAWSGRTLEELDAMPEWKLFNRWRGSSRAPGGELMLDVQRRVVDELARLGRDYPGKTVAIFSHADVIKAAVLHYMGAPVDFMERIEVHPGSVTRIRLHEWGPVIGSVNEPARCEEGGGATPAPVRAQG